MISILSQSETDDEIETGKRRCAGAGANQLDVGDVLFDQLQPVEDRRRRDDRGAVLVVVKDRNLHSGAELLFDVEAFRRLDVLQVDAPESRLHPGDGFDQCVRIVLGEFDIEYVDPCELLEQARLAFHDRLARQRADIPKAEHGGAVGDDGHEVAARGQFVRLQRVLGNDQARLRHAGRIRQRQIALRCHRRGRHDGDLPRRRQAMIFERGFPQILIHRGPRFHSFVREVVRHLPLLYRRWCGHGFEAALTVAMHPHVGRMRSAQVVPRRRVRRM